MDRKIEIHLQMLQHSKNTYRYTTPTGDGPYDDIYCLEFDITPYNNLYNFFNVKDRDELRKQIYNAYLKDGDTKDLIDLLKGLNISYDVHFIEIEP